MKTRGRMLGSIVACLLVLAGVAFAQPSNKDEAASAYQAGQALYVKEDFLGAAARFRAAYDLDPDPVYLFNIAQAMRRANRCREAGAYYRRYLDEAKHAPNEEAVQGYLREVDACARTQPPGPDETATPPRPPAPVEPPPPAERDADAARLPPPAETPAAPRSNKRLVGYILSGAGVAGVGLGFFYMSRVAALEDDANAVCMRPCDAWDAAKADKRAAIDDKAHLREKLMVGSWIAGGAALAAGVYLIVTGGPRQESGVAVLPTRNGAMVSLTF